MKLNSDWFVATVVQYDDVFTRLLAVFSAAFGRERSHPLLVEASSFSSSSSESSSSSSYSSSRLARHVRQHSDPEDRHATMMSAGSI